MLCDQVSIVNTVALQQNTFRNKNHHITVIAVQETK